MALAHGFVSTGSSGSHLGGIFYALWSTSLIYLTHGNRKTTWTLTIDAISWLNYCQSSLSTSTHTHRHTDRQTGECLSCLLYSWRKRDHLRTMVVLYSHLRFSQTNVQIYSIDYVSVYSKRARILINFPCYNLRLPPAPSGTEWMTYTSYLLCATAAWWPLCARKIWNLWTNETAKSMPSTYI